MRLEFAFLIRTMNTGTWIRSFVAIMLYRDPTSSDFFSSLPFFLSFLSLIASQPFISDDLLPAASHKRLETVHCLLHYSFLTFLPFSMPTLDFRRSKGRPGCCLPPFRWPETPNRASRWAGQAKIWPHGRELIKVVRTGHSDLQKEI